MASSRWRPPSFGFCCIAVKKLSQPSIIAGPCSRSLQPMNLFLEQQLRTRLGRLQHRAKFRLDALDRALSVAFEAQHDHRRGVGSAREAEAVGVFHAQAVELDDFARAGKARALL